MGAISTRETIALARRARDAGTTAISAVTPYYFRLPEQAIIDHYCRVADAVPDTPVYLYNIPRNTGNVLTAGMAAAIVARCPNVVGIKDSAGSLRKLLAFKEVNHGRFQVVCGSDALVLRALRGGACASVSGNANVFPEVVVAVFEAFWQGDWARARRCQARLDQVRQILGRNDSFSLMKRALALRGVKGGSVRPPLLEASDEMVADLERRLRALQLLG